MRRIYQCSAKVAIHAEIRLTPRWFNKDNLVQPFLEVTAETDEGEIMGIRHQEYPIHGVQFHLESILTEHGRQILSNFLKLTTT